MMPPGGWMNDPNGFIFFDGRYHLFYQYNPYAPQWGLMYWGHSVSDDLVRWRHLPAALSPDQPYDCNGCFSGTAAVREGMLYLFYTGNAMDGRQTQCVAVSRDGVRFRKYEGNPVISRPPDTGKPNHFRDPGVFRRDGRYYMVVGNSSRQHRQGRAILYGSDDLLRWAYVGTIAADGESVGYMWECPSLFSLGGSDVLMLSPQGVNADPACQPGYNSGYFVGRLDVRTGAYAHGSFRLLDHGFDFYAPQTTLDASGRRLMVAWMNIWDTPMPTARCQWAGSMTLPRVLSLENGAVRSRPVQEIERYRKPLFCALNVRVSQLPPLRGRACELLVQVAALDTDVLTLLLFCSADGKEYTALTYDRRTRRLLLDREHSGEGVGGTRSVTPEGSAEALELRIFLDRSSVEVFVNDGAYVMTARVYPQASSDRITLRGEGKLRRFELWSLE